jgi:hypothetical protein
MYRRVSPHQGAASLQRFFSTPALVTPLHRHNAMDDGLSQVESHHRRDPTTRTVTIAPDQVERSGTSRSPSLSGRKGGVIKGYAAGSSAAWSAPANAQEKGPDQTARPQRGNEPVLIPMYAKTSRRPPPSRPFLNLLCSLVYLPLRCLCERLLDCPLMLFGAFSNTHEQRCQPRGSARA